MNSANKVITISVAAYNAEAYLSRCLDSLVKTSVLDKLDIIIVNDGSTDKTLEIANEYCRRYPDACRVINKENGGHGSTINASLMQATGKYYKVVDSDDFVDKEGFEKLVNWLEKEEVDCVMNPFSTVDANDYSVIETIYPYDENCIIGEINDIDDLTGLKLAMHSITFNTKSVKKMGPVIDEKCFYVDLEYVILSLINVKSCICFDYTVYYYLLGSAEQSVSMNNMIARREQRLKVVKRVIDAYEKNKMIMGKGKRETIARHVKYIVIDQYKLYSLMGANLSREEIIDFDNYLRNTSGELYNELIGMFFYIIKLGRLTGFVFHALIFEFLKRHNLLK